MPPVPPQPPPLFPAFSGEAASNETGGLGERYQVFLRSYRLNHKWKSSLSKLRGDLARPEKDFKCLRLDGEASLIKFSREMSRTSSPGLRTTSATLAKDRLIARPATNSTTTTSTTGSTPTTKTTRTSTTPAPTTSSTKPSTTTTRPTLLLYNATDLGRSFNANKVFFKADIFDFNNQSDLVSSASTIAGLNSTFLVFNFLLVPVAIILATLLLFLLALIPLRCRAKGKAKTAKAPSFSAYYGLPTVNSTSSLDRNSSGLISAYLNATPSSTLLNSKRTKYELIESLRSQILAASEEYSTYLNASTLQRLSDLRAAGSYSSLNNPVRLGASETGGAVSLVPGLLNETKNEYYHASNLLLFNNDPPYSTLNDLNKSRSGARLSSSLVRTKYNLGDGSEEPANLFSQPSPPAPPNDDTFPKVSYLSTFGRSCMNNKQSRAPPAPIPAALLPPAPPPAAAEAIRQRSSEPDLLEPDYASCHQVCKARPVEVVPSPAINSEEPAPGAFTIVRPKESFGQSDIYSRARVFPRTNPKCRAARNSLVGGCELEQPAMRHSLSASLADLDNVPVFCSKL